MHTESLSVGHFKVAAWLSLVCYVSLTVAVPVRDVKIPLRSRTEGQLTLLAHLTDNHETARYDLIFSEILDSLKSQSMVVIGHVSHQPTRYYKRKGSQILTIGPERDGVCLALAASMEFVPEISWFSDLMFAGASTGPENYLDSHYVGPTGVFFKLLYLARSSSNKQIAEESYKGTRRGIPCQVQFKKMRLEPQGIEVGIELYYPESDISLGSSNQEYFSVVATATNLNNEAGVSNISFIVDYQQFQTWDIFGAEADDPLNREFHLPAGCSECLEPLDLGPFEFLQASFSISYDQQSTLIPVRLFYDYVTNTLAKEQLAASWDIWDLNKKVVYYVETNRTHLLGAQQRHRPEAGGRCSALDVSSPNLSSLFLPSQQWDRFYLVKFLMGSTKLVYMGPGIVRDMPCRIYESIVPEVPAIFATVGSKQDSDDEHDDYIVQLYVLSNEGQSSGTGLQLCLSQEKFRPVRSVLMRRSRTQGGISSIVQMDKLEIYDFTFDSVTGDPFDSLIPSDCVDLEQEVVEVLNLELGLNIEPKDKESSTSDRSGSLWSMNRLKLERGLMINFINLLEIHRMQMIEFELGHQRLNHLNLKLTVADSLKLRQLKLVADGILHSEWLNEAENQVVIYSPHASDEGSCVAFGSHMSKSENVSMLLYCPRHPIHYSTMQSICVTVTKEYEPTILKQFETQQRDGPRCRAYTFGDSVLQKATAAIANKSYKLLKFWFTFEAENQNGTSQVWNAEVDNFQLEHKPKLISIDNYAYQSSGETAVVNKLQANNINDCIRMCSLDSSCRSFSYCDDESSRDNDQTDGIGQNFPEQGSCVLSQLDIRSANLSQQLAQTAEPSVLQTVSGNNNGLPMVYNVTFKANCKIWERNYLDMFEQTNEVISLPPTVKATESTALTTFDCAKLSVDRYARDESDPKHRHSVAGHQFAYCGSENLCILDSSKFSWPKVSSKVLTKSISQIQLTRSMGSINDCARACWRQMSQLCASFDFCDHQPGTCYINTNNTSLEFETRPRCLHYERKEGFGEAQTRLSEARYFALEGSVERDEVHFSFYLLSLALASMFCVLGLSMGQRLNDKLQTASESCGCQLGSKRTVQSISRDLEMRINSTRDIDMSVFRRESKDEEQSLAKDF